MNAAGRQPEEQRVEGVTPVACILVNYRSPWEMLSGCLDSIFANAGEVPVRVIVVDNASGDGIPARVSEAYPRVVVIDMPGNLGFAAAVNRGLEEAWEPYALMLNTDALLTPGALESMVKTLGDAGDSVAGVAPKMMSSSHAGVIDAIGTVMPRWGASFNRGIGQCDLGQYDRSEQVAGVCFGAALLRRSLFEAEAIGPLYEGYFLYFEDADWCMRAVSCGYSFMTAPGAEVLHLHSGVTRNESHEFKYRLIELNTLKMVTRTFGSGRGAARIVCARSYRLLARTFIRRRMIRANLATLASYLAQLPRLLAERRQLKLRRVASDQPIFELAEGEHAYFDTVQYRPDRCLESLIDTYLRLLGQRQDPNLGKILAALYHLQLESSRGVAPALTPGLRELFAGQPQCARDLLETITPGS